MRKSVFPIITAIFLALSVTGCSQAKVKQEIENSSGSYNAESSAETWQEAYIDFLKDTNKENTEFSLRDLDNNGIP